jgi:hypothetical protein
MKLPMFKRLATDVAPPIAALLAFTACALALGLLMEVCGAIIRYSIGANAFT